jgi:DNA-binding transcriptional LysR family regulator
LIHFTLRQIEYFAAAVQHGGTAKAARALNVSQPSISHAIGELEAQWNEKLFFRVHARGLELTSAGKRRYRQAQLLLQQAMQLGQGVEDRVEGDLSVGCFSTLGPMYLPGIIRTFQKQYPQVNINMVEGDTEEMLRMIERDTLDLALIYDMGLVRPVQLHHVGQQSPYVLLPNGHRLASKNTVSVKDLEGERFILISLPHSRDYFLSIFRFAGVAPDVVAESASIEMVRSLVANGHGISILITRPSRDYSYDGKRIVCKALSGTFPPQKIALASTMERKLSSADEAFLRIARAHFSH